MKTESFASVLRKNLQKNQDYIRSNKIEAFRLYNQENLCWPLAIDIYQSNAVIHIFEEVRPVYLEEIEPALSQVLGINDFFYKNRTKNPHYKLPKSSQKQITVTEYEHKFAINLSDYLDTGLFLDHRETRKWIQGLSKGKVVLNTFAYTGSFTIYAAAGGAQKTYSVDLSKTYCDCIKQNLALNKLSEEKNWVYKMDTLEFFAYAKRKNLLFDIIIIDPPTFSRNKGERFSVQNDHHALINAALEVLSPTGFILFSNNFVNFSLNRAAIINPITQRPPQITSKTDTFPPDFAGSHPHHCFIIKH